MKIFLSVSVVILSLVVVIVSQANQIKGLNHKVQEKISENAGLQLLHDRVVEQHRIETINREAYINRIRAAENEIETLRDDLSDSRKRLQIGAVCPSGVPEAGGPGGDTGKAAKLDASSERAYIRLRKRIAEAEAWIDLCHATVVGHSSAY